MFWPTPGLVKEPFGTASSSLVKGMVLILGGKSRVFDSRDGFLDPNCDRCALNYISEQLERGLLQIVQPDQILWYYNLNPLQSSSSLSHKSSPPDKLFTAQATTARMCFWFPWEQMAPSFVKPSLLEAELAMWKHRRKWAVKSCLNSRYKHPPNFICFSDVFGTLSPPPHILHAAFIHPSIFPLIMSSLIISDSIPLLSIPTSGSWIGFFTRKGSILPFFNLPPVSFPP